VLRFRRLPLLKEAVVVVARAAVAQVQVLQQVRVQAGPAADLRPHRVPE